MHVFRLGSKSVNYANRIIMQETRPSDGGYQLMKNISLSNISDAGAIQSNEDNDDAMRMRKFSTDMYAAQFNYPFEARRKPSVDYRYDIAC